MDTLIREKPVQTPRKRLTLQWRQNTHGKYLRIVEEVKGHRDMVIIPESALSEFMGAASEVVGGDGRA
jgi:hypothetical protein